MILSVIAEHHIRFLWSGYFYFDKIEMRVCDHKKHLTKDAVIIDVFSSVYNVPVSASPFNSNLIKSAYHHYVILIIYSLHFSVFIWREIHKLLLSAFTRFDCICPVYKNKKLFSNLPIDRFLIRASRVGRRFSKNNQRITS